jgi:hypothetical protein
MFTRYVTHLTSEALGFSEKQRNSLILKKYIQDLGDIEQFLATAK